MIQPSLAIEFYETLHGLLTSNDQITFSYNRTTNQITCRLEDAYQKFEPTEAKHENLHLALKLAANPEPEESSILTIIRNLDADSVQISFD